MDMKTGRIYDSRATAEALGIPSERLENVAVADGVITVATGPFKGRCYEMANGKRGRRRKDLERKANG